MDAKPSEGSYLVDDNIIYILGSKLANQLYSYIQIVHQSMFYPTISEPSTAQNSSRYDVKINKNQVLTMV